jgi:hypothetical protein
MIWMEEAMIYFIYPNIHMQKLRNEVSALFRKEI